MNFSIGNISTTDFIFDPNFYYFRNDELKKWIKLENPIGRKREFKRLEKDSHEVTIDDERI